MTRKKLNLAYIPNDTMRKASFIKRKKGFLKKIHELTVLCDIKACAVIHSPFTSIPEMYPSHSGVKETVEKFEKISDLEQEKKMVDHATFLGQNISKTVEGNMKRMKENDDSTMKEIMFQCLAGHEDKLMLSNQNRIDLVKYIDQYLKELHHHKNELMMKQSHFEYGGSSSNVAPSMALAPRAEVGYYPMMNPVSGYELPPNFNNPNYNQYQYEQQFGYPIMAQDGINNANQNQTQQEGVVIDQAMNYPNQMEFPTMDENNPYYYHQP